MDNKTYHATPAIGSSFIKTVAEKTPLHAWSQYIDPNRPAQEPTDAMLMGTIIHSAVLEPEKFDDEYTVLPEGLDRRTKEGKELYAAIIATGKTPIKQDTMELVHRISNAANSHPKFAKLREHECYFEHSIFHHSVDSGLLFKIRPDLLIYPCDEFPNGLILDLKTTADASPVGFGKQLWNLQMHVQAAFYQIVFMQHAGTPGRPEFRWLAQEKTAGFANAMYRCTEEITLAGEHVIADTLPIIQRCYETGVWPGYDAEVIDAELPSWAYNQIEDELTITTEE